MNNGGAPPAGGKYLSFLSIVVLLLLSGGLAHAGAPVTLNPAAGGLYFYSQVLQTSSTPLPLTITNQQPVSLTINSITTSADYPFTTNCVDGSGTGTLGPSASCTVQVSFNPQGLGSRSGTLSIAESASQTPLTAPLQGNGIAGTPGITVTVTPRSSCVMPSMTQQFSAYFTGTTNTAVNWYVDNVAGGNSTVGRITAAGLYTAPAASASHTIKATSKNSGSLTNTTPISVTTGASFTIYPYVSSIIPGGQQTFEAQVCSVPDQGTASYTVDNIAGGNATVGTITSAGVYTAPATTGKHTVRVTDAAMNKTSGAVVNVYSNISADFGSRTYTAYPIAPNMFGAGRGDSMQNTSDRSLLASGGLTISRLYAQIPIVYATTTPNWSKIDGMISAIQAAGQQAMLQMSYSPTWLQTGTCGQTSAPSDVNKWAQIAAAYVAHMDANFPGVVSDYEIWNEPDTGGMCSSNHLNSYMALYAAAAPAMKTQAAADGTTIRIGGPVLSTYNATWLSKFLSSTTTAPYVDFVSYHHYLFGSGNLQVEWDTYNGAPSMYEGTQDTNTGAMAEYNRVLAQVKTGNQPLGANTPVYITEFNTNWAFFQDCCRTDATFSPLWNSLFASDVLNSVYNGASAAPAKLIYFAGSAYPWFCVVGVMDANMDCLYSVGATPVPYPPYYAFQLLSTSNYLGLAGGGYMAKSVSPPSGGGGLVATAFYTPTQNTILVTNPTPTAYSLLPVNFLNTGFLIPKATLYQIASGRSINSSSVALTPIASGFTTAINIPAYSVQAIAITGP